MANYTSTFSDNEFTIHVNQDVLNTWVKYKQLSTEPEACGVLIASKTLDKNEFWLDLVTSPFDGDIRKIFSFVLQDKRHQKIVDQSFKDSKGQMTYMGTWHTHPQHIPEPSFVDKLDWRRCIKRNPDKQLFFIIVGITDIYCFYSVKQKFSKLNLVHKGNHAS